MKLAEETRDDIQELKLAVIERIGAAETDTARAADSARSAHHRIDMLVKAIWGVVSVVLIQVLVLVLGKVLG